MTKAEFLAQAPVAAIQAGLRLEVDPLLIVAHAAHESNWGKQMPQCADGSPSWNFFGIKAGSAWLGAVAEAKTREWNGKEYIIVHARFRAYPSLAAGFRGYAEFIRGNVRYKIPVNPTPEQYLRALMDGGYATDPYYESKVLEIYRQLRAQ